MGENTNRSEPFFDEDVDLVKLQFTDIFGQCKMVQMTRRQAEKAMKEGYAINRFALGGDRCSIGVRTQHCRCGNAEKDQCGYHYIDQ